MTHFATTLLLPIALTLAGSPGPSAAQETEPVSARDPTRSIAREWNEVLLYAIRRDFARPTVHARNLFHASAAVYDARAIHDESASPYFLGRTQRNGERCEFTEAQRSIFRDVAGEDARQASRSTAISFAMYRLLQQRFEGSPGEAAVRRRADELFLALGLDRTIDSTDLEAEPTSAVLGNLIAECIVRQGARDGSNEADGFGNRRYEPLNAPLDPTASGNPTLSDPNRWQPLQLDIFVDQSGNATGTPRFLGAEWGEVLPFALTPADVSEVRRDGPELPDLSRPGPACHGSATTRHATPTTSAATRSWRCGRRTWTRPTASTGTSRRQASATSVPCPRVRRRSTRSTITSRAGRARASRGGTP